VLGLIPLDQLQRLQHRPVHRVVRPELQRLQDLDQPGPVVVGVGGLEAPLPGLPVGRPLRLELAHQVQQHLQPAGRGVHDLLDDAVRPLGRRRGDLEQDVLLARNLPGDLGDELVPRPGLGSGVDPVHRGDQQLDQAVGDLPLPAVQVGRHQRPAAVVGVVIAQVTRCLYRHPGPPPGHDLRRHVGEQARRESHGPYPVELAPLGLARVQADVARVRPDCRPHFRPCCLPGRARVACGLGGLVAGVVARSCDHRPHPGRDLIVQAAADLGGQRLLRLAQRRPDHPADPDPGRLLDLLLSHPRQQRLADPLGLALPAADVIGQPCGEFLGVGHRALPEPQERADHAPEPFSRPAFPVEQPHVRGRDLHLPGDPGDRLIGQFRASRREPALRDEELQPQRQPQLRRPRPASPQAELITDQRPVLDQLVFVQHTRHGCGPPGGQALLPSPHEFTAILTVRS
jgi:hypothetical protein